MLRIWGRFLKKSSAKTFQTMGLDLFFALCVDWLFRKNLLFSGRRGAAIYANIVCSPAERANNGKKIKPVLKIL